MTCRHYVICSTERDQHWPLMGKCKSLFDLNHDWITHNGLIWNIIIWFWKRVIWFGFDLKFCDLIWNHSKSYFFHNTMLLRVIDERRRPCFHCFVVNPLSISNRQLNTDSNSEIKNYLELTIIGVCKTVLIFARFDSYYVNWTFSKIWHFGKIDLWFVLVIWFEICPSLTLTLTSGVPDVFETQCRLRAINLSHVAKPKAERDVLVTCGVREEKLQSS